MIIRNAVTCCIFLSFLTLTQTIDLCSIEFSEDITNGTKNGGSIVKNGITYPMGTYYYSNGTIRGCVCKVKKCIRKCCENDETSSIEQECTMDANVTDIILNIYREDRYVNKVSMRKEFHVLNNQDCDTPLGLVKLDSKMSANDVHYVQDDGRLFMPMGNNLKWYHYHRYCVEMEMQLDGNYELTMHICLTDNDMNIHEIRKQKIESWMCTGKGI